MNKYSEWKVKSTLKMKRVKETKLLGGKRMQSKLLLSNCWLAVLVHFTLALGKEVFVLFFANHSLTSK